MDHNTFTDKLNFYLKAQQLGLAIGYAEDELRKLPNSPFHVIINRSLLHQAEALRSYVDEFYSLATKHFSSHKSRFRNKFLHSLFGYRSQPVAAIHGKMNDIGINNDQWFISLSAFIKEGDIDDVEWLDDFDHTTESRFTVTGLEDLQALYHEFTINRKWGDKHLDLCSELCEHLITLRVHELFQKAKDIANGNIKWATIPIYVTDHYHELVYKIR